MQMHNGTIGLGRLGASMVTRRMRGQHDGVVHAQPPEGIGSR